MRSILALLLTVVLTSAAAAEPKLLWETKGLAAPESAVLLAVNLEDQSIEPLGQGEPVGNLDGLEPLKSGDYLVTDWADGALYSIGAKGKATQLIDLNQGSADLTYFPDTDTVLIPMMLDNTLAAYRLSASAPKAEKKK